MIEDPDPRQTQAVLAWVQALRRHEAEKNAGDPGPVLARRLSNAEYNYTIRELTGVDLRPTREFPVDPANVEGFDNSGESLTLSPALLKKYLRAAREVAEHLVFKPEGEATVLDNSCLMLLSNMWSGNQHDSTRLPILTVGGLGGHLQTGRVLDYVGKADSDRKVCDLYLALMNKMGVPLTHFGDADAPLAGV